MRTLLTILFLCLLILLPIHSRAQTVITGHVLFAGKPITDYVSGDPLQFWMRDDSTGQEFPGGKEYNNGLYKFTGVPEGKYNIIFEYDGAAPAGWGYPGDYMGNAIVDISGGADTVFQDINCLKSMHLVSPVDNAIVLGYNHDSIPTYSNNKIRFAWDSIAEVTTYPYIVYVSNNQGGTGSIYGSTQAIEIELVFEDNKAGEHYEFHVQAYGPSGFVGFLRMNYANGFGAGYRFIVASDANGVLESGSNIPRQYSLSQNYPNPFNPVTTINYQLPAQSHVTLKIFDVLGREVATLVDGMEEPGYKTVPFSVGANGNSPLPSGVYYYRLMSNNYTDVKKMLIIK
jgi:hypothetical protein